MARPRKVAKKAVQAPSRGRSIHRRDAAHTVRAFQVGDRQPDLQSMVDEIEGYWDVLLGRVEPPINVGTMTLMEVASTYHARALELTHDILRAEREGAVMKGSSHYKFRTGELRTFVDAAKATAELGSRRLSAESLLFEQERLGRDL